MIHPIITTAIVLTLLDATYLHLITPIFNKQIKLVQRSDISIRTPAAIACYIFIVLGLYYFIIRGRKSILDAFILGLVVYAIYELTNYSLFKKWTLQTVIVDTLWGGILYSLTTWIVYKIK